MKREKIFNLPGVVTALIAVLTIVHFAIVSYPRSIGVWSLIYLSFIPARVSFLFAPSETLRALAYADADEVAALLNTARYSWWTPLTYAFLHANWTHLIVNGVMLAAFGTPVAQRFGPVRFLLFFAVTAIAGAVAHLAAHPFDLAPVVGASAGISGAVAAIVRFAFARGGALSDEGQSGLVSGEAEAQPAALKRVFSDRRAVTFLLAWLGANMVFGLFAQAPGGDGVIAWEAHTGGFLAGLLLFGLFDPTPRRDLRS